MTVADVAGVDEAKAGLEEVVGFLKEQARAKAPAIIFFDERGARMLLEKETLSELELRQLKLEAA